MQASGRLALAGHREAAQEIVLQVGVQAVAALLGDGVDVGLTMRRRRRVPCHLEARAEDVLVAPLGGAGEVAEIGESDAATGTDVDGVAQECQDEEPVEEIEAEAVEGVEEAQRDTGPARGAAAVRQATERRHPLGDGLEEGGVTARLVAVHRPERREPGVEFLFLVAEGRGLARRARTSAKSRLRLRSSLRSFRPPLPSKIRRGSRWTVSKYLESAHTACGRSHGLQGPPLLPPNPRARRHPQAGEESDGDDPRREKAETSTKTVQRLIDNFRDEFRAPLEWDARRGTYLYSEPGWHLPWLAMEGADLFAVGVAMKVLQLYEGRRPRRT